VLILSSFNASLFCTGHIHRLRASAIPSDLVPPRVVLPYLGVDEFCEQFKNSVQALLVAQFSYEAANSENFSFASNFW
jgi:hypothetical protein